ncbi:hypothetical protein [Limnospira indica]|uniref:hypothetical protein n=1 Tax=Limnospira indica TaxID=147322 RepID=UPI000A9245A0|nr:hypothetical protein [Limnospira indica]
MTVWNSAGILTKKITKLDAIAPKKSVFKPILANDTEKRLVTIKWVLSKNESTRLWYI